MEHPGQRNPETAVVQPEADRPEGAPAPKAEAGFALVHRRGGTGHDAERRPVVARSAGIAPTPREPAAAARLDAGASLTSAVGPSRAEIRPSSEARGRMVGEMGAHRDHIHGAADGTRSVEQGRRSDQYLDPFRLARVDRHPVLGGLAAQVARADAILQDQHPIPVESPEDRPGRTRPEAADCDAGPAFQQLGEARVPLHQPEAAEGGKRTEPGSLAQLAGGRRDRDVLAGREPKPDADRFAQDVFGGRARVRDENGLSGKESEGGSEGDGGTGIHPVEREAPLGVGVDRVARGFEDDFGPARRGAARGDDDAAADPQPCRGHRRKQRDREREAERARRQRAGRRERTTGKRGRRARPSARRATVSGLWMKRPAWESVLEEMGNPIVRAGAGLPEGEFAPGDTRVHRPGGCGAPHRMAARIARATRSALFRGEGGPSPHPSPAALRAASASQPAREGLSPQPVRAPRRRVSGTRH